MIDEMCELEQEAVLPERSRQIGFQLKVLDLKLHRYMENHIRKDGFEGMSVSNVWIIQYLAHNQNQSIFQKDIEKKFHIGKSSIAGTLKVMEEKGVIIRQSVEGDARLKRVCLTEKGLEYARKMKEKKESMEQKICEGISEADMDCFFSVVSKMQENLSI